jgi:hypothetical protein
MNKTDVLSLLKSHGIDGDKLKSISSDLDEMEEAEEYGRMEDQAAAAYEDAAHGYDFDEEAGRTYDPNTGMSVYDFDPGIKYNDGGEPQGYM